MLFRGILYFVTPVRRTGAHRQIKRPGNMFLERDRNAYDLSQHRQCVFDAVALVCVCVCVAASRWFFHPPPFKILLLLKRTRSMSTVSEVEQLLLQYLYKVTGL